MVTEVNGIFYLIGIVSSSLLDRNHDCDISNFALYTNVLKFTEWIKNPTKQETFETTSYAAKPLIEATEVITVPPTEAITPTEPMTNPTEPTTTPTEEITFPAEAITIQTEVVAVRAESVSNLTKEECGMMSSSTSLIEGGSFASRELFPWTVAVYNAEEFPDQEWHLNTGTLVSNRHVVVGARFVAFKDYSLKPASWFKMYFGLFD